MTIIYVIEEKDPWRFATALPMLRVFTLVRWLRRPLVDAFGSVVDSMPAVTLVVLLSYIAAVLGGQFFAGQVSVDSGYPIDGKAKNGNIQLTFDSFDASVLVLTQVAVGSWSRILQAGAFSPGTQTQDTTLVVLYELVS